MFAEKETTVLGNLPVMAFHCLNNDSRTLQWVSAGCRELTGYTAEELNSGSFAFTDIIYSSDREEVRLKIHQAIQENRAYDLIYRLQTAWGQERWIREIGQAIYAEDGTADSISAIVTDHQEQTVKLRLLEQRVADRTGQLAALYDILEAVSDATTMQATFMRILDLVLQAIGVDAGAIHLLEPSGEKLELVAQSGLPELLLESTRTLNLPESPLVGWVVRQGKILLIPHLDRDPRSQPLAQNIPYTLYAGVPITASDQIFGVLSVLSLDETNFQMQEEVDLLLSVGEQIGVVVENAKLREDAEQLKIIEERNRLARELHDSVTQSLYSVTLFAEAGRRMLAQGDNKQAAVYLADVAQTGRQALKEMRLLVHRLRPSILTQEGLIRAIQHRLNAVEGRAGVVNQLIVEGDLQLNSPLEEALYHITQEALNNALKHSAATEVVVVLRALEDGALDLRIIDNGRGFEADKVQGMGGLGLTSMRERAEMVGGKMTCTSIPGEGTTIHVLLRKPVSFEDTQ